MNAPDKFIATIKSIVKLALQWRPTSIPRKDSNSNRIVIMANGPSLTTTIREHTRLLTTCDTMAVNFAAVAPEFPELRPRYYVLADPHFFSGKQEPNLLKLQEKLRNIDWAMTLLVPGKYVKKARELYGDKIKICAFNAIGAEGFDAVCHFLFDKKMAMPRPRNVLIPSIMLAMAMGYSEIILTGADHSWMKTLNVNEHNEIVSIQPHFYKDNEQEHARVLHEYRGYHLYQIVESFAVAFKSYVEIQNYAASRGVTIINATPESFIDAFPRAKAGELYR
ncbi:MAG: hypothetical protein K2I69_00455 [Muribaculaceae bacterium]|nr:hypothetical protein [Muribaculaceae bacterium]